jgi:hypothetical protein
MPRTPAPPADDLPDLEALAEQLEEARHHGRRRFGMARLLFIAGIVETYQRALREVAS